MSNLADELLADEEATAFLCKHLEADVLAALVLSGDAFNARLKARGEQPWTLKEFLSNVLCDYARSVGVYGSEAHVALTARWVEGDELGTAH